MGYIEGEDRNQIILFPENIIDLISFNEPVGGIISVYKIFAEIVKSNKCDIKKLVKHAVCFPNIKTRKPESRVIDK